MSEVRLSALELQYFQSTLDLILEELEGVEEATDYVLTTGAKEDCIDCLKLIDLKFKFLEPDSEMVYMEDMGESLESIVAEDLGEDDDESSLPPWEEE